MPRFQDVLASVQFPMYFLVLLFAAKLLATSLTLGSGASGGVFSPALFLGATAGGAYGVVLHRIFPSLHISAPAFAVAGMAGVVGGSTGRGHGCDRNDLRDDARLHGDHSNDIDCCHQLRCTTKRDEG